MIAHVRSRTVDLQLENMHDGRKVVSLLIAGAITPLRSMEEQLSPLLDHGILNADAVFLIS